MRIFEGQSMASTGAAAVAEATEGWPVSPPPDLVLVFTSAERPAGDVAAELAARFPAAQIAGCTTAGEHLSGQHTTGGLVAVGVSSSRLRWATVMLEGLATVDAARARVAVDALFAQLGIERDVFDPQRYFCLCFIDGLSYSEEVVLPLIAEALCGVAIVGGSAGDDLKFVRTEVICGGRAASDAAVLTLCESSIAFSLFKQEHFVAPTPRMLAVTRADVVCRRVYELDGVPAARAYAAALGISRDQLDASITSTRPLLFECEKQGYIRSIRQIHDDDSLSFYCALEEGMVVDICDRGDLLQSLEADLEKAAGGQPASLVIGSNCCLRALESSARDEHAAVGAIFRRFSKHMIGFDTYGEQLNGMHINQTFVALVLHDDKEAA